MVVADPLPTGQPRLDAALRSGGWPRGALALLDAPTGGGATSLALGSLAACQADGGLVAWLDPSARFDPATAARLGVELEWLLVVRPADPAEAVELAGWLARSPPDRPARPRPGRCPATPRPGPPRRSAAARRRHGPVAGPGPPGARPPAGWPGCGWRWHGGAVLHFILPIRFLLFL